jgi:transcriptional regulator with XRE-family HTH domain
MTNLAKVMKARRASLGLTLSDAAQATGIARSYLYQLERGESVPTVDKLQAIARAYGTSVGALIGETELQPVTKRDRAMLIMQRALDLIEALD